eukprot:4535245-Prymnesium_polylepis.1
MRRPAEPSLVVNQFDARWEPPRLSDLGAGAHPPFVTGVSLRVRYVAVRRTHTFTVQPAVRGRSSGDRGVGLIDDPHVATGLSFQLANSSISQLCYPVHRCVDVAAAGGR